RNARADSGLAAQYRILSILDGANPPIDPGRDPRGLAGGREFERESTDIAGKDLNACVAALSSEPADIGTGAAAAGLAVRVDVADDSDSGDLLSARMAAQINGTEKSKGPARRHEKGRSCCDDWRRGRDRREYQG